MENNNNRLNMKEEDEESQQQSLSQSSSGRRSPDFEFWMVRNPSNIPDLHTADELFINGVLRPLHLLNSDPPDLEPFVPKSEHDPLVKTTDNEDAAGDGPELTAVGHESTTQLTASKRWKDILFKNGGSGKDKEKKKERKSQGRTSSAELNINIWPFSRSRSAGNNGVRPRQVAGVSITRKVSSAPCSRSNSAGDSKTRKLPYSPSRNGVHLGRSSPVWQVRRGSEKGVRKDVTENHRSKMPAVYAAASGGGCKTKVLKLNVPMCISYRNHLSCKSDGFGAVNVGSNGGAGGRVNSGDYSTGVVVVLSAVAAVVICLTSVVFLLRRDYDSSSDDGYFDEINFWEHPTDHPYANITIYHDISHYMNGLTINGSPLIRHGCLLQREVERSINNFQCPQCLRPTDVTVATHVNISLRWLEVYQGPSLPFQGFGRTVGDDRCFELESMYFQRFIPSGMPVAGPTMSTLSFTFIHNVDVWRNGFTIYGGNLMSYNPMNAHLLLGIKKFKCLLIPPYSMINR